MNIKKLAVMGIATLAMTVSATGFAQISRSEININGIYCGYPFSEIINRFGQPIDKRDRPPKGYTYTFRSGTSVFTVNSSGMGPISGMSVTSGRDFLTKAGIGIGSSLSDVKAAYGEPDYSWNESTNMIQYFTEVEDDHKYFVLLFGLDRSSGSVVSISFNELWWDGPLEDRPKPRQSKPQQEPSASREQVKPKSTIPDFVTEMPTSELNIGWIEPGQSMDNAEKVYGKPSKIDDEGFFQTYNYNDKFIVKGKMNNGYKVMSVASYEKGMKTPSGFMVGDSYSAVVKKFGAVKGIKFKGEGVEAKLKGCTDYTYFSGKKQMVFIVDKKDVIRAIRVEELDEQKFIEAKRKK